MSTFKQLILEGIPSTLPKNNHTRGNVDNAPKLKDVLSKDEKKLAVANSLRYFNKEYHEELSKEFLKELELYGHIYMYRFMPAYKIKARPISEYPGKSEKAKAIMLMIQNNLDEAVAQYPEELITYGGNGSVFQNWAQYLLCMKYLAQMTDKQTLVMNSGHPLGLFPSSENAPRVVVTNGIMIPNYSRPEDLEKFNALGVTQYGQMTAGSYMYIGPQGIVHGTTITILNACRKIDNQDNSTPKLFLTSGLGGMSGAQPKAGNISKVISVVAEVNPHAVEKRHKQGWVDEIISDIDALCNAVKKAKENKKVVSFAYQGNVVDVWEKFYQENILVDIGSDQSSLHNPFSGGYYPQGLSFEQAKKMIAKNPILFKKKVKESLRKQVDCINKHTARGTYFFDYGNAFLLEASRANADIYQEGSNTIFKYPSYVQDIVGPMCFDYGFGPFRWVCSSGLDEDLNTSDAIALKVLKDLLKDSPEEIKQQLEDNITWIKAARANKLVVGSKARILYSDAKGRVAISKAFNQAIKDKKIKAPIILGRDHHDVSGTDSPYRETSNIYDGSQFTADMATQNFVGDAFRGATWVSLHNGGGVGWGEVINGGFGMVIDGSSASNKAIESMLLWDVNNGIARRNWAGNLPAIFTIKKAMEENTNLKVTIPIIAEKSIINKLDI